MGKMTDNTRNELGIHQNDFEELCFYDLDSPVTRMVGEKVKHVFERLCKNTGVDSNDFAFLCFNSNSPNAFFMNKENTRNSGLKKNVIAVSDSLIRKLDREEEIAAVIAHECGHYFWQKNTSSDNTIVQERWSDAYSVELMYNAGYNPRYILEMQNKIFYYQGNNHVTLDVHGAPFARAEDVKACLTKKAAEIGDFDTIIKNKNLDWFNFQRDFNSLYPANDFHTFIEKKLLERFKTTDLEKINRVEFLKLILELVKVREIDGNHVVRIRNLSVIIGNKFQTKTKEETKLLQEIVLEMLKVALPGQVEYVLSKASLDLFGPFEEQYNNIKNFMDSYEDEAKAEEWAKKILDLKWTMDLMKCFKTGIPMYPDLKEKNIGKPLPRVKLASYKNRVIDEVCFMIDVRYNLRYPDPNSYFNNYYIKNGIVVAYGEEAERLYKEDNDEKTKLKRIETINKNTERFNLCIDYLNTFADYAAGKISNEQLLQFYLSKREGEQDATILIAPYLEYFSGSDDMVIPEMMELYQRFLSSRAIDFFVRGNEEPHENPNVRASQKVTANNIVRYINGYYMNDAACVIRICEAILRFNKYLNTLSDEYIDSMEKNFRILNLSLSNDLNNLKSHYYIKKCNAIAASKVAFKEKVPYSVFGEFKLGEESQYLRNIRTQLGYNGNIKDDIELKNLFNQINQRAYRDLYNTKELKLVLLTDYLRHGVRINLMDIIDLIDIDKLSDFGKQEIISDIWAKNISYEQFDSLMLYEQICFYEYMQSKKLFSNRYANQNEYIRKIVNQIVARPVTDSVAISYAEKILTRAAVTEYGKNQDNDLTFFNEREKLIDFYTTYWAEKLGLDDGSEIYLDKIKNFIDFIEHPSKEYKVDFSQVIKKQIMDRVSNKVVAQEKAAKMMASVSQLDVTEAQKNDKAIRVAEAMFGALARNQEAAVKMIDFLSNKLTQESLDDTLKYMNANVGETYQGVINRSDLMMVHENFWGADLPIRAYMMNRLLGAYSSKDEDKLKLVINMYFDEKSEYYKDATLVINTVYKNLQSYERNLILAALASAGQRDKNSNMSGGQAVGQGLKMFLQNKGPAYIKFGQLLSYLPTLDSDIRAELAKLRDKANIPNRDELFDIMRGALPESEMAKIEHVDRVLGAGSFFVTVQVKYDGRDCVIALMRPFAHDLTESGVKMISNTINDLVKADKKYAPLKNILNQARESAYSEIDIEQDHAKYMHAKGVYEKYSVTVGDATYSPDVAKWLAYGAANNGQNAYKIMEMADGHSLTSSEWSDEQKREFAIAYVTLELALLLSGEKWDTDRHQGQQNFANDGFRDFCIGIFDTGAQMKSEPGKVDKVMLGHLLYELAVGAKRGRGVGDVLVKSIRNIDNVAGKFGVDTAYIDGVQRGLTALSDIIEYQKEEKDEYGNVVRTAKTLNATDLENIVSVLYQSGVIDKTVTKTVVTRAILDKLMLWRAGLKIKSPETVEGQIENPIQLQYSGADISVEAASNIKKAQIEIEQIMAERAKRLPMGLKAKSGEIDGGGVSLV